jgi:hypothetical protein
MPRKLKRWIGVAIWVMAAGIAGVAASNNPEPAGRSDVIVLDTLRAFGPLERPPVFFLHDRHTDAIGREAKNCLVCHPEDGKRISLKFQRTEDADRESVMKIYHDGCIACHKAGRAQKTQTGPVTCGGCHVRSVTLPIDRQAIGMDQSLHYRHIDATDGECGSCHHQYDPDTQKLYYVEGQEESCLYCHKAQTEGNRISIRRAAHLSCIDCHHDYAGAPVECAGCHGPEQQALIQKVDNPPRLERNQPDTLLVRTHGKDTPATAPAAQMARVAFNHKAHENAVSSCRTCHHAALTPCADCHSIQGRPEGAGIQLEQAMHQPDASMSCVGCHNRVATTTASCAGCHGAMAPGRTGAFEAACQVCHMPDAGRNYPLDETVVRQKASELLAARRTEHPMAAAQDIPERVTIDDLVNHFEAVGMPHGRHVLRLSELAGKSPLASAFHTRPTTVCMGCHHHSPPSLTPPKCGECHGTTPGQLRAAFHEQCFQCHTRMGVAEPANRDCTACHARRRPAAGDGK